MSDGNLPTHVVEACRVALGGEADPSSLGRRIRGAVKDKNSKGNGPEWYRMVYRHKSWRYVSDERLPQGGYLASERRATVYGDVFSGEIVAQHDRGAPVSKVYLVTLAPVGEDCLVSVDFRSRRDGHLLVSLPDGSELVLSNPRSK